MFAGSWNKRIINLLHWEYNPPDYIAVICSEAKVGCFGPCDISTMLDWFRTWTSACSRSLQLYDFTLFPSALAFSLFHHFFLVFFFFFFFFLYIAAKWVLCVVNTISFFYLLCSISDQNVCATLLEEGKFTSFSLNPEAVDMCTLPATIKCLKFIFWGSSYNFYQMGPQSERER